jgi:hypothetical protein
VGGNIAQGGCANRLSVGNWIDKNGTEGMAVMAEQQQCSFFLLRYVPDAVKNEFVNIGLVLLPAAGPAEMRFTSDWTRARCLDPQVDMDVLEALETDLRARLSHGDGDRDSILRTIQDSFSNGLQTSDPKACLAESPALEADELARIYLERPVRRLPRENSPRQAIVDGMRREFESVGVWRVMRKDIKAAEFTSPGDPMKIDCGYDPNGTVKMFQALALPGDTNAAKLLAFTFPHLAHGIRKKQNKHAELTAIVSDHLEREEESVSFALETLAQQSITVAPLAQMANIAAQAAKEMRIRG